jgi:hypothetical protein
MNVFFRCDPIPDHHRPRRASIPVMQPISLEARDSAEEPDLLAPWFCSRELVLVQLGVESPPE